MDPIDVAYERFVTLAAEVSEYLYSIETEADTRLKVIDRILAEVLLWPYRELSAEAPTGEGLVDYLCKVGDRSRLVVEAKRDGRSLGLRE